jgi:ribosomal protein L7/L12
MHTEDKLYVIRQLSNLAEAHGSLADDALAMMAKVVSPPQSPPATNPAKQPLSPTLDELHLARRLGKIPAIKAYRQRLDIGLKEAKENIEEAMGCVCWEFGPMNGVSFSRPYLFEDIEPAPF